MNQETPDIARDVVNDGNEILKGHDVGSTGPSDSSDGGSDMAGLGRGNDNSDRNGTGERGGVDDVEAQPEKTDDQSEVDESDDDADDESEDEEDDDEE